MVRKKDSVQEALAFREAGHTQRCHTMQYIGTYNVAMHCYNALSLLFVLYPGEPSPNLVKALLWHDAPERWTGDVPTTAKRAYLPLNKALHELEEMILTKLGITEIFTRLNEIEIKWLHAIDLLELFMWTKEQEELGNKSLKTMNQQIMKIFQERKDNIPAEVQQFLDKFTWSRTKECHELIGG